MKKTKLLLIMLTLSSMLVGSAYASNINSPNIVYLPASTADFNPIASTTRTFHLDTSNGKVLYEGSVDGISSVTKSEVSAVIQRYEGNGRWMNVPGTAVSETANSYHVSFDNTVYVSRGYDYRMEITYAVYVGNTRYVKVVYTDSTLYS